ncbi:hypothetical protein C8J31_11485 [Rhizobium sp. PP-CC-2G-626]|nr:hypothetical protein C8J31_11485 [Rhizobium sp. PP-CC-2G-626]
MTGQEAIKYQATGNDAEPEMAWDSAYAERGRADRNIALRNRPDLKPVEERMNIVSNRIIDQDPHSNTTVRLESGYEGSAFTILKATPGVISIRAQYKVRIMIDGVWHDYWFDLVADYESGCRVLFAVRNEENVADVDMKVELFRNQELGKHANFAVVLTERDLSKPAVYRAEQILLARAAKNERDFRMVRQSLLDHGGRATVADVLLNVKGTPFARGWNAMWLLIDRGLVVHDHRHADTTMLRNHSVVRVNEEF